MNYDSFIDAVLKNTAIGVQKQIMLIAAREMRPLAHEILYLLNTAIVQYLSQNRLKYCKELGKLLTLEQYQAWLQEKRRQAEEELEAEIPF